MNKEQIEAIKKQSELELRNKIEMMKDFDFSPEEHKDMLDKLNFIYENNLRSLEHFSSK